MAGLNDILSNSHIVAAWYPVADSLINITSDCVALKNYKRATLIVSTGAIEDSGISNNLTIEACTDAAGTVAVAMAFRQRFSLSSTTVDSWSALTAAAAAGFNFSLTNAVANTIWMVEVTAAEVAAAVSGGCYVRAKVAETVDKTVTSGAIWILSEPRYPTSLPLDAIL